MSLLQRSLATGRSSTQPTALVGRAGNAVAGQCSVPRAPRSGILGRRAFPASAQSTYSGPTSTVRQAAYEEEDGLASYEPQYPPDGPPGVDEYDSPNDHGFWRMDIEDQAAFICNELDLTDEQALYLLNALGLLPEGASLPELREIREPVMQPPPMLEEAEPQPDQSVDALDDWQSPEEEEQAQISRRAADEALEQERWGGNGLEHEELVASPSGIMSHTPLAPNFVVSIKPNIQEIKPAGVRVSPGVPAITYDQSTFDKDYEVIQLRVIGRRASTAAAMGDEIELTPGKLIAGRYQVLEQVGAAAFSRAVQAYDTLERRLVCLKVVKNDKECMDACLEEVRLLQMINARDPRDEHHIARLYDYFYHLGHLFLVVELLGGNLFDTQCYDPSYFTPGRMQAIARQVLDGLAFLHSSNVIHADVKPENILVKNYSKCSVKLIDLGCSIYNSEAHMSHYVQSRSYRAPEVMLGLPYDGRIDVWSLGCVMAELATGQVLFPNVSEAAMMARMLGMLGEFPPHMLQQGQYAGAFFTRSGHVYERDPNSGLFQLLVPKRTTISARVASSDRGMLHFIRHLLVPDPAKRPTAAQALKHPWLQYRYRSPK